MGKLPYRQIRSEGERPEDGGLMTDSGGIWVRVVVWVRTQLGLIGFVFLNRSERNIGVNL